MKQLFFLAASLLLAVIPLACGSSEPAPASPAGPVVTATFTPTGSFTPTATFTRTVTNTPTVTATPPSLATIAYGGSLNYSPAAVTISAGGTIVWNNTYGSPGSHTLYIDTGSPTDPCNTNPAGHSYPSTIVFPSTGTYHFHCSLHTSCSTSCAGCSGGMSGMVVVQ